MALSRSRMSRSLPSRPFSMCTLKSPATKVSMPTGGLLDSSTVSTDSRSSGGRYTHQPDGGIYRAAWGAHDALEGTAWDEGPGADNF
eukprot:4013932-Heterocapsa_arctica.AAC.1